MKEVDVIYNQDCLEGMKQLDEGSIDLIATDPPYGYSFMGKDWDKSVPSVGVWRECLRILKHGAFLFVMSAPRLDVQTEMVKRISEAGFRVDFTPIYWVYSSEFPKSMHIGRMVDKRQGAIRQGAWSENNFANPVTYETGEAITEDAKRLEGSYAGFQPKPAVEVVIVAMKPLSEKTYVEQALKNGKGITWLDDCRIPFENSCDADKTIRTINPGTPGVGFGCGLYREDGGSIITSGEIFNSKGRFPANLLVSDQCLDIGEIKTGRKAVIDGGFGKGINTFGDGESSIIKSERGFDDSGDFSRYFDLDRWFEEQIKRSPKSFRVCLEKTFPFCVVPKPAKSEKNKGCESLPLRTDVGAYGDGIGNVPKVDGERPSGYRNIHPTCKPVKLMSYLVVLGSREGDVVLDPFMGSGTTAVAARNLSRHFIGFELSAEYKEIADARIKFECAQKKLWEVGEDNLFNKENE